MLKRIVDGLQIVALVLVVVTVAMLFRAGPAPAEGVANDTLGAQVYAASCAGCHGADGAGGRAPSLITGNLFDRFPDRASTIAFIEAGQGGMPGFGARLSTGELGAVTDFVRKELATQGS